MRLNGWQRIWVVIAGIFLLLIASIALYELPNEHEIYESYAKDTLDLLKARYKNPYMRSENVKDVNFDFLERSYHSLKWSYPDHTHKQIAEALQKKFSAIDDMNFSEINARYEKKIAELPKKRINYLIRGAGIWLLVIGSIYLVGWLIAWIIAGFKATQ